MSMIHTLYPLVSQHISHLIDAQLYSYILEYDYIHGNSCQVSVNNHVHCGESPFSFLGKQGI